jgi:hypothetical protein
MKFHYLTVILLVVLIFALVATVPASATKTVEQSISDSLTRGSRFTVTITGLPNSSYYIWLPHTSTMTGEPGDQPPFIADNIENVAKDPSGGPYPIGSYQYNNGNGQTIRDDVAASTATMPNTNYYAQVTTDTKGQAVVEFHTSLDTGLRSYSVRVESPASIDSDNLLVELHVYSRRAPSITIYTQEPTLERVVVTRVVTVITSPPIPTREPEPVTPMPQPIATTIPTTKAEAGLVPVTCAVILAALCIGIRR